jgi:hypothetical protein
MRFRTALLGIALAAGSLGAPSALATAEVKVYGITTWTNTCSGGERPSWDNMAHAWYDEMEDEGWPKDGSKTNGYMTQNLFCDPDAVSTGCEDWKHVDDADAMMIFTHGWDNAGYWNGVMRYDVGGGDCNIGLNEMYLGDIDAEFLHLSSCNSMDDENLARARTVFIDPNDKAKGTLHGLAGFHGVMWIDSSYTDEYGDFAEDAFDEPLAYAWVENLYDENASGNYDMCPVAMTIGPTLDNCLDRLDSERYDNIWSDPSSKNYWCAAAYVGCDPKNEDAFNF